MGLSMCLCTMHSQAWNSLRQTWVPVPEETLAKLKQLAAEEHVAVVEASCETCSAIVLESVKGVATHALATYFPPSAVADVTRKLHAPLFYGE